MRALMEWAGRKCGGLVFWRASWVEACCCPYASGSRGPLLATILVLLLALGCRSKPPQVPPPWTIYPPGQGSPAPPQFQPQQVGVTIQGEVRRPVVPWIEGLTLARALIMAEYFGARDPISIVIYRGHDAILVDTRQLLAGVKDPPLFPGDVVELRR